jgi:hypothetical protein
MQQTALELARSRAIAFARSLGIALSVFMLFCGGSSSANAAADVSYGGDATRLMRDVAAAYAASTEGVIGVRSHSELTIAAPVFRRHIVDDAWFVFRDGTLVASSKKPDPRQPPLHDPYKQRYLDEYAFQTAPCPACAPDTVAIAYESKSHDVAHAYGTLVIDRETSRIVSATETPYRLPWPTKRGVLAASWGGAAGAWFPLTIDGSFVGSIGPFVGHATYAQALSDYDRSPTVDAAVAALVQQTNLPSVPLQ